MPIDHSATRFLHEEEVERKALRIFAVELFHGLIHYEYQQQNKAPRREMFLKSAEAYMCRPDILNNLNNVTEYRQLFRKLEIAERLARLLHGVGATLVKQRMIRERASQFSDPEDSQRSG